MMASYPHVVEHPEAADEQSTYHRNGCIDIVVWKFEVIATLMDLVSTMVVQYRLHAAHFVIYGSRRLGHGSGRGGSLGRGDYQ